MNAKFVKFVAPGKTKLVEMPVQPPGPGQIVIDAELSLISAGTERTLLKGAPEYPFSPGYSLVGHVAEIGEGVDRFQVGDRVAASATHGSMVTCNADLAFKIPSAVTFEEAAFLTVGATALFSVRLAQLNLGDPVLIFGQGLIGLIASQIARSAGAMPVIGVDMDEARLELARSLGVDHAIHGSDQEQLAKLIEQLPGGGVAASVELSGAPATIEQAIRFTRRRGRIVAASMNPNGHNVDIYGEAWMKGLALVGSYINSRPWRLDCLEMYPPSDWPLNCYQSGEFEGNDVGTTAGDTATMLDLIAHDRVKVAPLISDRVKAKDAPALFDRLLQADFLGAQIEWK